MNKHVYMMSVEEYKSFLNTRAGINFLTKFAKDNGFDTLQRAYDESLADCIFENALVDQNCKTLDVEKQCHLEIGYFDTNEDGVIVWVHCNQELLRDAMKIGEIIINTKNHRSFPIYNAEFPLLQKIDDWREAAKEYDRNKF